jgi:hypothetical protein
MESNKMFFSYCHKDDLWRERLMNHGWPKFWASLG